MKPTDFHQNSIKITITYKEGHTPVLLCNFLCRIGNLPMPQLLIHGNHSRHRGETVCKKSATLTVRNLIFSGCQIWAIFTIFRYFSIVFDIFRAYTHREAFESVRNCLGQRLGVAWGLRDRSSCAQPVNISRVREEPCAHFLRTSNSRQNFHDFSSAI